MKDTEDPFVSLRVLLKQKVIKQHLYSNCNEHGLRVLLKQKVIKL